MNDLSIEPEFRTRIRFLIGAVFPSDDAIAQWIVNLGRASNDLMIANQRLYRGFRDDTPAEEHFYDIRSIAAHSWELAKFIEESRRDHPEIDQFIDDLRDDVVRDYLNVLEILESDAVELEQGKQWSFKAALASARDQASHYSKVGHKLLTAAMKRVAEEEGEMLVGPDYKDFNALFAATVDAQMFHPLDGDPEPFRQFSDQLQKVVGGLMRFSRHATDQYLQAHEDELTIEDF